MTTYSNSKKITVNRGQILQRKGDLNSKVYRVTSGLLRSFAIDDKGKEHIFMFAPEGWILADFCSPDEPCNLYIDALEDSTFMVSEKNHEDNIIDLQKLLKRVSVLQERTIMMMSSSAIERYEHFIATYPHLVQQVPQKMIASYLGITPEALSKVKGERNKELGVPPSIS